MRIRPITKKVYESLIGQSIVKINKALCAYVLQLFFHCKTFFKNYDFYTVKVVVEPAAAGGGGGPKPELTCISEEGIADMDLPDNILDDLDLIGDCITSCNKVENYLMLSEFENNLIAEMPVIMDRKGRRWSLAKHSEEENATSKPGKWRLIPGAPNRVITVIDEASV